jgi:hypothetical protein
VRCGQTRRSRSDDRNPFARRFDELVINGASQECGHFVGIRSDWRNEGLNIAKELVRGPDLGSELLASEPLQRSYREGPVGSDKAAIVVDAGDFASSACSLAWGAAYSPADRCEGIRPSGNQISLLEPPFGNRTNVTARIGMDGTGYLTRDQALMVIVGWHLNVE